MVHYFLKMGVLFPEKVCEKVWLKLCGSSGFGFARARAPLARRHAGFHLGDVTPAAAPGGLSAGVALYCMAHILSIPSILSALSILVAHLDSLHSPYILGIYILEFF